MIQYSGKVPVNPPSLFANVSVIICGKRSGEKIEGTAEIRNFRPKAAIPEKTAAGAA